MFKLWKRGRRVASWASACACLATIACEPVTLAALSGTVMNGGAAGGITSEAGSAGIGGASGTGGAGLAGAAGTAGSDGECSEVIRSPIPAVDPWEPVRDSHARNVAVTAIAVHPVNPNVVWVGYSDGSLYRTGNGAAESPLWTRLDEGVAGETSLPDRTITSILLEADRPFAYVGFQSIQNESTVWRTDRANIAGSQLGWSRLGFRVQGVVNIFQDPEEPGRLFVLDENGHTSCSASGGAEFAGTSCTWAKHVHPGEQARITLIYREPGAPNRVLVGYSDGSLYETDDVTQLEPSWVLRGSPFAAPQLPSGPIAHVTRAGFNGSRCLLVLNVPADQQVWCGGQDLWKPASATFAERQQLYGLAQRGRALEPTPSQPAKAPRLYLLTRHVGSFISDDLGSSWPYNDRALKVQFCAGDRALELTTELRLHFRITNEGKSGVPLENLVLKYWYGIDEPEATRSTRGENVSVEYAEIGSALVHAQSSLTSVGGPLSAPAYLDRTLTIGFTRAAGNLAAGASTGEIRVLITKDNGGAYNPHDDYSFEPNRAFLDHFTVALFQKSLEGGVPIERPIWGADPYYGR